MSDVQIISTIWLWIISIFDLKNCMFKEFNNKRKKVLQYLQDHMKDQSWQKRREDRTNFNRMLWCVDNLTIET